LTTIQHKQHQVLLQNSLKNIQKMHISSQSIVVNVTLPWAREKVRFFSKKKTILMIQLLKLKSINILFYLLTSVEILLFMNEICILNHKMKLL